MINTFGSCGLVNFSFFPEQSFAIENLKKLTLPDEAFYTSLVLLGVEFRTWDILFCYILRTTRINNSLFFPPPFSKEQKKELVTQWWAVVEKVLCI